MSKDQLGIIFAVILLAAVLGMVYFSSGGQQSIIPIGQGQVVAGTTTTWTSHLDKAIGSDLFALLGCSAQQVPVSVHYTTELKCMTSNSNGQYYSMNVVTDPTTPTTIQCNLFQGFNGAADMIGQSSATIPSNAVPGAAGCQIRSTYYGTWNGITQTILDSSWTSLLVQAPAATLCTAGSTTCLSAMVTATCVNGAYTNQVTCPSGCSNNVCIASCSPGQIKCNGNGQYQLCGANSQYGSMIFLNSATQSCVNNQLVGTPTTKTCPTGETIPVAQDCPNYCGDGTCNNGETSATCAKDCPAPVPPAPIIPPWIANNTTYIDGGGSVIPVPQPQVTDLTFYIIAGAFIVVVLAILYFAFVKKD